MKPGNRETGKPGNRETGKPGNRETGAASAPSRDVAGLSPHTLLRDGSPIASAILLSHEEQLHRLRAAVPEVAHTAVIAGDPCFDRLLASQSFRPRYRKALGATADQTVVAVSSTWSSKALLATGGELLAALLAELPLDEYRIVLITHPNVYYGHGLYATGNWLAVARRSGLTLVPPEFGWRAALTAADYVIGDHGSVTTYAAALGKPTLLGTFPQTEVAAGSAADRLGQAAPRLHLDRPIAAQLHAALGVERDVCEQVTSVPGEAAVRIRRLFYEMLALEEPRTEPPVPPDPPVGLPDRDWSWRPTAMYVSATVSDSGVDLTRFPAEMLQADGPRSSPADSHLIVSADHPGRQLLSIADIIVLTDGESWGCDAEIWIAETMRARPGVVVAVTDDGGCTVQFGDQRVRLSHGVHQRDPVLYASAMYAWVASGRPLTDLKPEMTIAGVTVSVARL